MEGQLAICLGSTKRGVISTFCFTLCSAKRDNRLLEFFFLHEGLRLQSKEVSRWAMLVKREGKGTEGIGWAFDFTVPVGYGQKCRFIKNWHRS